MSQENHASAMVRKGKSQLEPVRTYTDSESCDVCVDTRAYNICAAYKTRTSSGYDVSYVGGSYLEY